MALAVNAADQCAAGEPHGDRKDPLPPVRDPRMERVPQVILIGDPSPLCRTLSCYAVTYEYQGPRLSPREAPQGVERQRANSSI